ncbi:hypothetical protein [Mycobacterium sp. 1245852.3]|uniref:hypothetical protein n=1 Tax=Mycobacterium sp. 1245852.3 TaxID=1856860 RepID=UPI0007FE444D|nr:hypothetical protein [Mycobacterium sp. 1245852.3]OBJ81210.1 hypothetical protein A9W96_02925 [Mycobacterium sp. 1245852.3]
MTPTEWIVHPNRSEIGSDEPGRNGHYRSLTRPRKPAIEPCLARVRLPRRLSDVADADGTITFGGNDWWFVVGAARSFARTHVDSNVPPPFGFKRNGQWWWWDDTTSEESILEGPEGIDYVREYLARLFPRCTVTVSDAR